VCFIFLFVKKNKEDTSEDENEDYLICKALFKHCDREFTERLKAQYGLEDFDL
jgi:hypothetical protein